ncbi:MAG: gamma-glutamylcyclotransferase [Sphingomonadales bacterium]|nr:gamma-glutamylcyclotransferase [Sphingomonadales bacterium]
MPSHERAPLDDLCAAGHSRHRPAPAVAHADTLGSVWLWQHGYLLHWAIAACLAVLTAYLIQLRLLGGATPTKPDAKAEASLPDDAETDAPDPVWTSREMQAWKRVLAIASSATPDHIQGSDEALKLGLDTIRAVASTVHPEERDPLWKFTIPEALAILERVSVRMRVFVNENIPLGDRLTVAQMMAIYRWKGAIDLAEKAYDLWRLARFINPLSAATHEIRERLSREMLQWGRDHVARRLAATFALLDAYEGADFTRVIRQVTLRDDTTVWAWIYLLSDASASQLGELIADGDWVRHWNAQLE